MAPPHGKPPCTREDAEAVLRRLRQQGHIAYFAGGCVRDMVLGLPPKDFDIATDAPPQRVRELFTNTQAVGAAFGVILVRHGKSVVEVATFRAEGNYEDGRRPEHVRFTTAEEDAHRRDFTINALFLDPLEHDRVIDFVGGVNDLHARRLRAVGNANERFAEDHLRLLRAIRFAARFSLEIEQATADAMLRDAPLLKRISPERIADELRLMLTPPTRAGAWQLLWRFRLVEVIFRFVPLTPGLNLNPSRSIFLAAEPGAQISSGLAFALAALCARMQETRADDVRALVEKKSIHTLVQSLRQALKISNDESSEMEGALEGIALLLAVDYPRIAILKRFLARPTAAASRVILAALTSIGLHVQRGERLSHDLLELEKTDYAPPPLITGDDLLAAGLSPGPVFKQTLDVVYDQQLEGAITTRQAALAEALRLASPAPHSPP